MRHLEDEIIGDCESGAFSLGSDESIEVRALREKLVGDGKSWTDTRLRKVDTLIRRGDTESAREELEFLREQSLPDWLPAIEERASRL